MIIIFKVRDRKFLFNWLKKITFSSALDLVSNQQKHQNQGKLTSNYLNHTCVDFAYFHLRLNMKKKHMLLLLPSKSNVEAAASAAKGLESRVGGVGKLLQLLRRCWKELEVGGGGSMVPRNSEKVCLWWVLE